MAETWKFNGTASSNPAKTLPNQVDINGKAYLDDTLYYTFTFLEYNDEWTQISFGATGFWNSANSTYREANILVFDTAPIGELLTFLQSCATKQVNLHDQAEQCITDAYTAIGNKSGTIPTQKNLQNLAGAIGTISTGTDTSDGNIEPTTVLKGYKGYAKGVAVNGAIETYDGTVEDVSTGNSVNVHLTVSSSPVENATVSLYQSDTLLTNGTLPSDAVQIGSVLTLPYESSGGYTQTIAVEKQYLYAKQNQESGYIGWYAPTANLTIKSGEIATDLSIICAQVNGDGDISLANYRCLTGDTLITLADGTEKRIDELTLQDRVLAIDPETSKFVSDEITYTDSTEHKTFTEYDKWTFSDGTIVKTVHRHRFYNVEKQAMVYMDEWNVGDHAVNQNGERIALVSHENVKEEVKHYTIFTKHQNYFANGLLSGNRYTAELHL